MIDKEERNKYNLFLGVKGFQFAVFLKLSDGSYVLKITYLDDATGKEKIHRIPQTESSIKRYGRIINDSEEIKVESKEQKGEKTTISKDKKSKKAEFYLGISLYPAAIISISGYSPYGPGLEISSVIELEDLKISSVIEPVDMVLSGNFILAPPTTYRFIPFATIGLGKCIHNVFFLNYGGGIKIKLKENLGFRIEYRHFQSYDASEGAILGGISYYFF